MLTPRENFLRLIHNEPTEGLVADYEALTVVRTDPVTALEYGDRRRGNTCKDVYGTTIAWPREQPGAIPYITDENRVIKDVANWRCELVLPDYDAMEDRLDWSENAALCAKVDRNKTLLTSIMATGFFERLHLLMGFEEALMNLYEEPEAMHDLLDALLEVRMSYVRQLAKHMHPEVIINHDDFGNKKNLFMSPSVWQEFFKERYRKLYSYMQELGIIVVHHADCYCASIAGEMAEMGVQVWQGVIPDNDIPALQKQLAGKMVLMGGIDVLIDKKDWTEEEVRRETRRACTEYGPGGSFIPCLTYGGPKSIFPGVTETIVDEIHRFNRENARP